MLFNKYSNIAGTHAFLSASKPHWTRYDDEKLDRAYTAHEAARRGTRLHELAAMMIREGVRLPQRRTTMNLYVNDAIGYRMTPEQPLVYSENCYGTPDTISFRRNMLRIHDLKTGVTQTSFTQLEVYAAIFCLEYHMRPFNIEMELRIYQHNEVRVLNPDPDDIVHIVEKIKHFDKRIAAMKKEDNE